MFISTCVLETLNTHGSLCEAEISEARCFMAVYTTTLANIHSTVVAAAIDQQGRVMVLHALQIVLKHCLISD